MKLTPGVLARMPLADSVLSVVGWIANESFLADLYERHRGRCSEQFITFASLVQLISDALIRFRGSGRQSFEHAIEAGRLDTSVQAAYRKLGRVPLEVSTALLAACTSRAMELLPAAGAADDSALLKQFHVVVLDGKAIKRVAKRLKSLRGTSGGVLGGRALVAQSLNTGLALAMHTDQDGDANDIRFLPDLLPVVRERISEPRLWLADRAFCGPNLCDQFSEEDDHFLVRYSNSNTFTRDEGRAIRRGRDAEGRTFVERWGWLGSKKHHSQRAYVRQITLQRSGEEPLIIVTSLVGQQYKARDLLELYRRRWGIENMFQQVTEVFGLEALIGSTPKATVFQFAFCLLLYNVIQVVRAYLAAAQKRCPQTISAEKLFVDIVEELVAWKVIVPPRATIEYLKRFSSAALARRHLHKLLDKRWTSRWLKAPTRKRRPVKKRPGASRTHKSAFRLIQAHEKKQLAKKRRGR